jgi:hypothetical protein
MLTLEAEHNDDWMYCVNESLFGADVKGRVIGTVEFGRRVTVRSAEETTSGTSSATLLFLPGDPAPRSPNVSSFEISSTKISSSSMLDILQYSLMEGSTLIFGSR